MREKKEFSTKREDAGSIRLGKFSFTTKTPFLEKQLHRKGFHNLDLLAHWEKVVGRNLLPYSLPVYIKIISEKKTLFVQVFETRVIEFQHQKDFYLHHINEMAGFQMLDEICFLRVNKIPKTKYNKPKPVSKTEFLEKHPSLERKNYEFVNKNLQITFNHLAHYIIPIKEENKTTQQNNDSPQTQKPKKAWLIEYEKQLKK